MLTSSKIAKAEPRNKPYSLYDGKGLSLLVTTGGAKIWHVKKGGVDHILGYYPNETSIFLEASPMFYLGEARREAEKARTLYRKSGQVIGELKKMTRERGKRAASDSILSFLIDKRLGAR